MQFEDIKNRIKEKHFFKKFAVFLAQKNQWFLLVAALGLLGYCGYLWNKHLYNSQWSESEKQRYIQDKERKVVFDRREFDKVISEMESRKEEYQRNIDDLEDIFQAK